MGAPDAASIATSLRELACFLAVRPELGDIAVICAVVPSGTETQTRAARAHHGALRL